MSQSTDVGESAPQAPEPIVEAAKPGQSEDEIDAKIREAGYDPYPDTPDVPDALYRERLTTWLNQRAGIAFVSDQYPTNTRVLVDFELPFGGEFSQEFARPDSKADTAISYPDFLEILDCGVEDIEALDHREVPITRDDSEWCVDPMATRASGSPDSSTRAPWEVPRYRYIVALAANRLVFFPVVCGLAITAGVYNRPLEQNLPLLVLGCLLLAQLVIGVGLSSGGYGLDSDTGGTTPGWVDND